MPASTTSSLRRDDIERLSQHGLSFSETWQVVDHFERLIAEYFGAPMAVAVDCCTHALELCLRLEAARGPLSIPARTYMSVPMMLDKLSIPYSLVDHAWKKYYAMTDRTIDAATLWMPGSYIANQMMCLSFQFKKALPIGRGGMILLDDPHSYERLQRMVRDGRDRRLTQWDDPVAELGYHYYMTPEDAARGIHLFHEICHGPASYWTYQDYKDLRSMPYFADR